MTREEAYEIVVSDPRLTRLPRAERERIMDLLVLTGGLDAAPLDPIPAPEGKAETPDDLRLLTGIVAVLKRIDHQIEQLQEQVGEIATQLEVRRTP